MSDGFNRYPVLYAPGLDTIYWADMPNGAVINGPGLVPVREGISIKPPTRRNAKSASGWRNPSGWNRTEEDWTPYVPGTVRDLVNGGYPGPGYTEVYENSVNHSAGKVSLPDIQDWMYNSAITKALSKLKGQKVNLSVAFGERREAAEMMAHTVTSIAKQVRRFRHLNPKDWAKVIRTEIGRKGTARRVRDDIPNRWLELQYGWKPLMSDVHGAVSALNNKERDGDAYRATVKAGVQDPINKVVTVDGGSGYSLRDLQVVGISGYSVRLDYVLENPVLATLAQLGITNPLELVWELVPYSFVIDWFLPVGSYLSSLDAAVGWTFMGGTGTFYARQTVTSGLPYLDPYYEPFHDRSVAGLSRYRGKHFIMNREVFSSSPLPRFPGLKNPLSTGHIANAMSLLVSAFR